MRIHQAMLAVLICSYASHTMATTTPPLDASATTSAEAIITNDPLAKINISDEEKSYIAAECKRFAIDDEITKDDLFDYLTLCNHELTIAVKTALLKRKVQKQRQIEAIKASRHAGNRPQPM